MMTSNASAWLDALLYVLVATCGYMTGSLGSDEAAKWVSPQVLFWLKFGVGAAGAGALAFKMFRSTSYADSRKVVDAKPEGKTQ